MNKRIQELIEKLNLTSSKFADEIGVPRSSISHIVSGRNKPSLDFVTKIIENYPEVNFNWLIFGRGECFSGDIESGHMDTSSADTLKETEKEASDKNLFSQTNKEETSKEDIKQSHNEALKDEEPERYNAENTSKTTKKQDNIKAVKTELGNDNIEKLIVFYNDKSFEVFNKR